MDRGLKSGQNVCLCGGNKSNKKERNKGSIKWDRNKQMVEGGGGGGALGE